MSGQASSGDSSDWLGLAGRVCVVTGGGGGIGRATALSLARAGASVAAIDRDEKGLATTEAELHKHGGTHLVTSCDTTNADSVTAASQAIEKALGPCDVLVNTAAILRPGALDSLTLAEWNSVLAVNLTGYFLCAQIFGRQMRAQGRGSLVHVSSIAGSNAQGQSGAYSVSKAGVIMLSQQLANEWGPHQWHPQQRRQPRHGDHADGARPLRHVSAGVTERRAAVVLSRRGRPAGRRTSPTPSCSSPATARPMSMATRSRSTAVTSTC